MLCLRDSIRDDDPSLQWLLRAVEDAPSLTAFILAPWQVARVLAIHLSEAVLADRAHQPTVWPPCPACGAALRSQGCAPRQRMSVVGPIQWHRRIGRCPQGCAIPQVAPLDEGLGVQPQQRTSAELQALGWAGAILVPFATAARLLGWSWGRMVSPRAVWCWGRAAGHQAMAHLQAELDRVAQGYTPTPEPLATELATCPLALGAAGVMVPLRPVAGVPTGKTRWRAITVGVLARLGQPRTRLGQGVTRLQQRRWRSWVTSRRSRRACGVKPCARGSGPRRRWCGAVRVAGAGGACLRSALCARRRGSGTCPMRPKTSGRRRPLGGLGGPRRLGDGFSGHGTACGMADRTVGWPTWRTPWSWRGCLRPHGTPS
jgi:hypothetical protein